METLPDDFFSAFEAAASDPDPRVRREVARTGSHRWILLPDNRPPDPRMVELILRLARDPHAGTRDFACYFGLNQLVRSDDRYIRPIIEAGLTGDDPFSAEIQHHGAYHMQHIPRERLLPVFEPYFQQHRTKPDVAVWAYALYYGATHQPPPQPERFDDLGKFVVEFLADEPLAANPRLLLAEFRQAVPEALYETVAIMTDEQISRSAGLAIVNTIAGRRRLIERINSSQRIRATDNFTIATPKALSGVKDLIERNRADGVTDAPATLPTYAEAFQAAHEHLGRKYPCFELKKIDWTKVGEELLPRARRAQTDEEFGLLCLELVARLQDSHSYLQDGTAKVPRPAMPQWDVGLACLMDDRDRPVVFHVDPDSPARKAGIRPGDTIIAVNAQPADEAIAGWEKRISTYYGYSSPRTRRFDAARSFTAQLNQGDPVNLVIEDISGRQRGVPLTASRRTRAPKLPVAIPRINQNADVSWTKLPDGVGYIYVRRIRETLGADFDRALADLGQIMGLVLDLRGNTGGGFVNGNMMPDLRPFNPEDNGQPERPRYTGAMAVLLDERCISAGESLASWFVATRRARSFGATTAGASSAKEDYTLTNNLYRIHFTVRLRYGALARPVEHLGIEPEVPVRCTARDLAAGRDTVLEAARHYLKGAG